jgi:hypothetical protein
MSCAFGVGWTQSEEQSMTEEAGKVDDAECFITKVPYLVGTLLLAVCLIFEIRALQEKDAIFLLWLGLTPVAFFVIMAGTAGASGLPGGAMMPWPIIQLSFFSFVVGLSSVIFYASITTSAWAISGWIIVLGGLALMIIATLLLGNFPYLLDHPFKRWLSERWGLAGIALVVLTMTEAAVLGIVHGRGYNSMMLVLAVTTALKLTTCAFAPRSIPMAAAA